MANEIEKKPETKGKLEKWLGQLTGYESFVYLLAGLTIMMLGLTSLNGGGIGIRATAEGEINWIELGDLPRWVYWSFVIFGFDIALFRGKGISFIISRLPLPGFSRVKKVIKEKELRTSEENTDAGSKRSQLGDKQYKILQRKNKRFS